MNKLIIFDFDGTIADSMWCWDALGKDMMIANNIPIFDDYDKVIRTMSVPHFAIYMSKYYPQLGTSENIMNKWHEKMIFNYKTKVHLKKGVVPFLEYLKSMHYTLYLASATHLKVLSKALAHFQINHYFDFIITEETIGISKRDPKIYQICMDKQELMQSMFIFLKMRIMLSLLQLN
jgi:beta-phosphoglucomutase-like phosphatase (HAD superfamily)